MSEGAAAAFHVQFVTIFPEFFDSVLSTSILAKAIEREHVSVERFDIRGFATDKHRTTDDVPYGGGAGMVMKPEPAVRAIEAAMASHSGIPRIYMTPQGEPAEERRRATGRKKHAPKNCLAVEQKPKKALPNSTPCL